uniref:Tim44-like domain-containing protein n=1 Tax=Strigamia maritima TaxID=126957 RepID=T1JDY9_STRMM
MAATAFLLNHVQMKFKSWIINLNAFSSYSFTFLKPTTATRHILLKSSPFYQRRFSLFSHKFHFQNKKNLTCTIKAKYLSSHGNGVQKNPEKYIRLMDFHEIFWPAIFKHVENKLLLDSIMNLRFESDFNSKQFLYDAQDAVVKVSHHLSKGELKMLQGIVTKEAMSEIEINLKRMTQRQKENIKMKSENIYLAFIYTFNVKITGPTNDEKRFVEIICCFHSLSNFEELKNERRRYDPYGPPFTFTTILENAELVTICNYSFIRDYSEGVKSYWMINKLNHFKPSDIPDPFDMFRIY